MKKVFLSAILAAVLLVSGCSSGVSQESYNSVVEENSRLLEQNKNLNNSKDDLSSENEKLNSQNKELLNQLEQLQQETAGWVKLNDTEKQIKQAEAEIKLKDTVQTLTEIEKEEKRRLTEGTKVYEDNYITVNFWGIGKCPEFSNKESIIFLVENKTEIPLTFFSDCVSLDAIDVGHLTNYDSVSPKSKGKIYFIKYDDTNPDFDNKNPSFVSGSLLVRDMNNTGVLGKVQYEFSFFNINV